MVCVFGLYSETRGGIVPHANWSKQARLLKGSGEAGLGTLSKRVILCTFGIAIFAAAWALVHFYEIKVPDEEARGAPEARIARHSLIAAAATR
jgi:hypothetical protein